MMKLQLPRPKHEDIGLNLTPLIDVVFLLLIFLLVTTTFNRPAFLDIELPTLSADPSTPEQTVEVVIQVDGTLIIDGQRWDRQITLEQALANALSQHPQALIMVLPDPNSPSQSMLNVLSASGALGQTRVLFSGVERVEP